MIADILLYQKNNGFDLTIENGDFKIDPSYETALWASIFTDARADSSQVPEPQLRRGWMGDLDTIGKQRQLGGLLWLVEQRRLISATLGECIDLIKKSLLWFIEDKILYDLVVTGEIIPRKGLMIYIETFSFRGETESYHIPLWRETGNVHK